MDKEEEKDRMRSGANEVDGKGDNKEMKRIEEVEASDKEMEGRKDERREVKKTDN